MPHATEADIAPAAPPHQHGMASDADVLPEQSLGAGLTEYGHQMGGFFEGLWNKAKGAVGALLPDDPSKAAVEAPIRVLAGAADALHSHIKNLQGLQDKAEQSLAKGDIADFLGHMQTLSVEGVLPGIGQAADAAKAKWDAGDKVGATADAAALTSQALLGAKAGDLAKAGLNAGAYTVAGARAAAPGVIGGMAKAGVGEVLAKIPGMELPARFGLQYPAIRQVAKALEKGAAAGRAAIAPEAAAATEAAAPRPVRASKAPTATVPPAAPPPETPAPPTAPGKTAADLLNEEMGTKETAPPVTAKAPGQALAESHGETWSKLSQDDKLSYAQMEGAQASSEARNPAPPPYIPRGPEHYGVKPAEVPPIPPPPSAPAPAQPASAAPPAANITPIRQSSGELSSAPSTPRPVTTPETEDIDFQQRYGEQEQPEVAKFLGHEQPEPPQPKPASGAVKANAQAKADRFVQAIRRFNSDNPQQALTADELAAAGDEEKSMLTRGLQQGGYLKNTETFTDKSFPYILSKLRDAETAARQTIKPPKGFSLGEMGTKH